MLNLAKFGTYFGNFYATGDILIVVQNIEK